MDQSTELVAELWRRLNAGEDNWSEFKPASVTPDRIRKAVCAFANALPEGETAVLFVGANNRGEIDNVPDTDKRQQTITAAIDLIYPPVVTTKHVLTDSKGNKVIAVRVFSSLDRPHFTGRAFMRVGSESKDLTEAHYGQFVARRSGKVERLALAKKNAEHVTVFHWRPIDGRSINNECVVEEYTSHYVIFRTVPRQSVQENAENLAFTVERIALNWDVNKNRLQVEIKKVW